MVVLKCSNNGFVAVICNKTIRVFSLKESKQVYKYSLCDESTGDSTECQDENKESLNTMYTHGCAFSNSGKFLVAFFDNKDLVVWSTERDWKQIGKRKVPKRPTAVLFTHKEDHVVISDKAGDVYSYSISESLSNETLLLGHVSMILDMAISKDDQYIVTADRDEKIRVSCFPNSYNIEAFCLGHSEYVWKVIILENLPDILVSTSGDGTVRFWNFKLGKAIHVETFEDKCLNVATPVVSCMTCSKHKNVVFIGIEGSSLLHAFEVTAGNEVRCLSDSAMTLNGPPCSLTVDHSDCLWVVQLHKDQPIVVFEMKVDAGCYKFDRLSCCSVSLLMSTGWDLYAGLKQRPCLENLKKKEGPGLSHYYNRKKDRMEAKRKKDGNLDDTNCTAPKRIKA